MKGLILIFVCCVILLGVAGCNLPRHLIQEEEIVYYFEQVDDYIDPIGGPHPIPGPPFTPIINPIVNNPIDRQPDKLKDDGNTYGKRDPLQGGSQRGSGEIKSDPPVRKPQQNDRVQ
jgi:hypothetical protein